MDAIPMLRFQTKLRASISREHVHVDMPVSSDQLLLPGKHLALAREQRGYFANSALDLNLEQYKRLLDKKLQSVSTEEMRLLARLVVEVIVCPMWGADAPEGVATLPACVKLVREVFGASVPPGEIDRLFEEMRDEEQDVVGELTRHLDLLQSTPEGNHPVYPASDFEGEGPYGEWKTLRRSEVDRGLRELRSRPPFRGRVSISVLRARGLRVKSRSAVQIHYVVKVGAETRNSAKVECARGDDRTCDVNFVEEEAFSFAISERRSRIRIEVWCRRYMLSTLLGCAEMCPMALMWQEQPVERWWALEGQTEMGEIYGRVKIGYVIGSSSTAAAATKPPPSGEGWPYHPKWYAYLHYLALRHRCVVEQMESPRVASVTHRATRRPDPVPLTAELAWLLDNFASRHFVDPAYRRLVPVQVLTESFNPQSLRHLEALHEALIELEAWRVAESVHWRPARELYERIVNERLASYLIESLANYFARFPENKPERALSLLVMLYATVMKADVTAMLVQLQRRIKEVMSRAYRNVVEDRITELSMIEACQFVSFAIEQDERYFQDVFPAELNLLQLSIETYYQEHLCENVKSLLRNSLAAMEDMITLYECLEALNKRLLRLSPQLEVLQLNTVFQPGVDKWIKRIDRELPTWFHGAYLRDETWVAISVEDPKCAQLHARSAHVLFEVFDQIYTRYRMFDMHLPSDLLKLEGVFAHALEMYARAITEAACNIFGVVCVAPSLSARAFPLSGDLLPLQILPDKFGARGEGAQQQQQLYIPSKGCVWISTLEMMTKRLYDFRKAMQADDRHQRRGEEARQYFESMLSCLVHVELQIGRLVIRLINSHPSLERIVNALLDVPADMKLTERGVLSRLEPLFDYINSSVDILCKNLDSNVLLRLLELLWHALVQDLQESLFSLASERRASLKGLQFVQRAFPSLIQFFHAAGDGLSLEFLELESEPIKCAFAIARVPTGPLIKAYADVANGLTPHDMPGAGKLDHVVIESYIIAILSARRGEKDARRFSKANRAATVARVAFKTFDLPAGETVENWFVCASGGRPPSSLSHLYITSNYICYCSNFWEDYRFKIRFSQVRSYERKRVSIAAYLITLRLTDGQSVQFGLDKIKMYEYIVSQFEKMGYILENVSGKSKETHAHGGDQMSPNRSLGRDALAIPGAEPIANQTECASLFGLSNRDQGIARYDCALLSSSSSSKKKATPCKGHLYIFSSSLCFRGDGAKRWAISWSSITHLGQSNQRRNLVVQTKKKQRILSQLQSPDQVFTLLRTLMQIC